MFWVGWVFFGLVLAAILRSAGNDSLETRTGAGGGAFRNGASHRDVGGLLLQDDPADKNTAVASATDTRDGSRGADVLLGEYWGVRCAWV